MPQLGCQFMALALKQKEKQDSDLQIDNCSSINCGA